MYHLKPTKRMIRGNGKTAILVELKEPYNSRCKWLFGSKRAIYRQLPAKVLGISYTTLLCHHNLTEPFENDKCTITRLELYRTATNRCKQ